MNFKTKLIVGGSLLVGSWILVVLMFLGIIPLSFVLSFVIYGASVAGLFIGMLGVFEYVRIQRARGKKNDEDDENRIDKMF
ncbi:hypothetical protein [Pseudothermotoga thermarum]|uniref:Uncharacterized protein n=1 Tax=Pseudothermotoga thermarum DSM 5069 TaxID=688269 RepID=F7YTY7_9THEM|nr:hypothetical protein [Pseudothermotoga thermarum]AEH51569.1 hypothetical protein Theth_1516 [Pseudothermotoga thermarum DSM 5069]